VVWEKPLALNKYRQKRNFARTPEPSGETRARTRPKDARIYVVQKHRASQLHYDFRLELNGVLLSWAVPKGPSLDPSVKRLAMRVEDHPLEYANFEGVIPEGGYGAGTVMVWDNGTWTPQGEDVEAALEKGDFKFALQGQKLKGSWVLVRTRGFGSRADESWLLIKHRDRSASTKDITVAKARSVQSGRLLAEIAREEGGDVEQAATGDPAPKPRSAAGKKRTAKRRA
jgi:bifunctional non-homologous end joining protein LigD